MEIEERLLTHPTISEASVVGIKTQRYGEVVGCFLKAAGKTPAGDDGIRQFVGQVVGRHKAPTHIFWLGDEGAG
ncbi:uncharacterized protein BO95DRAFT_513668 [Aspergillus brunneoviolaceus CBS 621.78]|uniref:Uncharacterized protein n=1 Tax=Aspergillus brunneoviolaceus CBS 621.78 TaxID=1450534 RepID=A0ACD1GC13_9EURO|nr:hypothetical protein BO95DRAFT_513668 [Aspergillus brunneoviolaceus CBS 621.78]RAH46669.1 hypothetical protein BO95DRAFT_513668 [Aspergillus brunneoviolaceus CBS 621.78]